MCEDSSNIVISDDNFNFCIFVSILFLFKKQESGVKTKYLSFDMILSAFLVRGDWNI